MYLGDCMDLMRDKPHKCWNLAIVDPPYGNAIMCKNKYQRHKTKDTSYRNRNIPTLEYYEELGRVSNRQIIWGFQYQYQNLPPSGSLLVWDKMAEPELHNMSSCDIAWYSKPHRIERIRLSWCGAVKCEKEPTIHIHQKPVQLYKWQLKKYAKSGDKILDTHGGSFSCAIACCDLGFDIDIIEIDPIYYQSGKNRVLSHIQTQEEIKKYGYAKTELNKVNPTLF